MLSQQTFLLQLIIILIIIGISEFIGSCSHNDTSNSTSLFLITFGSGSEQYSKKTPADFNFSNNYRQQKSTPPDVGEFAFVNSLNRQSNDWHNIISDHTKNDTGGYMYIIDISEVDSKLFNMAVTNLCVGLRYQFSTHLANIVHKNGNNPKPNIRFEVRNATTNKNLLAQVNTSDIPDYDTMTWSKYGVSFIASSSSVVLLMISNRGDRSGNNLAIDDIDLRVCTTDHSGYCPPGECYPKCKNNGTCLEENKCQCSNGFIGHRCEIESIGLCSDNDTINNKSFFLITFDSGSPSQPFSSRTPSSFNFNTSYEQKTSGEVNVGQFGFVNAVPKRNNYWHDGTLDHTENDAGGYMYFIDMSGNGNQLFVSTINNLSIGLRYEFSAYLANAIRKSQVAHKPNIRFEVRSSTSENNLLAQFDTDEIPDYNLMKWCKYGVSFIASSRSVVLIMVPNNRDPNGNDVAIDDIELRVCTTSDSDSLGETSTHALSTFVSSTKIITTTAKKESTTRSTTVQTTKLTTVSTSIMTTTQIRTERQTSITRTTTSSMLEGCKGLPFIGPKCDVAGNLCDQLKPCKNNGTCSIINNNQAYTCSCATGFSGADCDSNNRPCKSNTCLNDGICNETSNTTFTCICKEGWQGLQCDSMINFCHVKNAVCENKGVCKPLLLNYKCECLGDSYSGRHCEHIAQKINTHKMISKSFSYVAIIALTSVATFIIVMDILKYCFGIDPVETERERMRRERRVIKPKRRVNH